MARIRGAADLRALASRSVARRFVERGQNHFDHGSARRGSGGLRLFRIALSVTPDDEEAGTVSDLRNHLVMTASPRLLHNYAKVVNGPAWYPKARVRPISWVTIKGWRMRAVFVPEETNDGSPSMYHVVLVWIVGQHTYGVGFHDSDALWASHDWIKRTLHCPTRPGFRIQTFARLS